MRELSNTASWYAIEAGKCFQRTRYLSVWNSDLIFKNSHQILLKKICYLLRNFYFCAPKSKESQSYQIFDKFRFLWKSETILVFQTAGLVFWKPFPLSEIWIYSSSKNSSTSRPLNLFKNCLAFVNKHLMLQGGLNDNFSGYPLITYSVSHAGEVLKT